MQRSKLSAPYSITSSAVSAICGGISTLLVGNRSDAGRRIDHGLLVVCDEATAGPIKVKDYINDADDEQAHDVGGEPGAPRLECARITCKSSRDGGNGVKSQRHDVRHPVAKCGQANLLVVNRLVEGLDK